MGRFYDRIRYHVSLCKFTISAVTIIIFFAFSVSLFVPIPEKSAEMLNYMLFILLPFWFGRSTKGMDKKDEK